MPGKFNSLKKLERLLRLQARTGKMSGAIYPLKGSVKQRNRMRDFLQSNGFTISYTRKNIPGLTGREEFGRALTLIWQKRSEIQDWWKYKRQMLDYNVCTPEELKSALHDYFAGDAGGRFFNWLNNWFSKR